MKFSIIKCSFCILSLMVCPTSCKYPPRTIGYIFNVKKLFLNFGLYWICDWNEVSSIFSFSSLGSIPFSKLSFLGEVAYVLMHIFHVIDMRDLLPCKGFFWRRVIHSSILLIFKITIGIMRPM
jgi:hypothetical protein